MLLQAFFISQKAFRHSVGKGKTSYKHIITYSSRTRMPTKKLNLFFAQKYEFGVFGYTRKQRSCTTFSNADDEKIG